MTAHLADDCGRRGVKALVVITSAVPVERAAWLRRPAPARGGRQGARPPRQPKIVTEPNEVES
ncbi:hypothetical protein FHS29_007070 [Saccharothrix tamanrassetensis]|uniref:Uncharacterized protein n=1 Tax=Saccharothrix tamanrassetensis TaxID=1051531 RepID=A0A841CYP3_9PSEU|nr:hypothetical protein [Saccharothrix tamanrassetensis]MBB5960446.1 hypothetical protein [Saccharothrix tamanrassetensis]